MQSSWIERWRGLRIFVLGDVMIDKFIYGHVERVSPEAPIPVLLYRNSSTVLGGAGNVARNIVALGGVAVLAGVVGEDEPAAIAWKAAESEGITARFARVGGHPTTVKTRFVSGSQQIMRLDVEAKLRLEAATAAEIFTAYAAEAPSLAAVVLSDYAKGVLESGLIRRIIDDARARGLPVVVDPKAHDVARYAGASVITPNASEAAMISGEDCDDDAAAEATARKVRAAARVKAVIVTRGAQGMSVYPSAPDTDDVRHIPTVATDVFDVSGAGDTVVGTLALALGAGADLLTAARLANAAAGLAVGKQGAAAVLAIELAAAVGGLQAADDPKIVDNDSAFDIAHDWKARGLRVGFTNGCFDLLHPGHVELLRQARAACDRLVVGLNTDSSIRRLKGENRPVQNEQARGLVMAAIKSVDLVTFFDEDTPMRLIERLRPDILVKGADYTEDTVVGASFVRSYGGRIVLAPIQPGYSTTSMIERAHRGSKS